MLKTYYYTVRLLQNIA